MMPNSRKAKPNDWQKAAIEVADLVATKQKAYGDSFGRSGEVLRQLYPNGITPDKYDDLLTIARILDKLFRIATDPDALKEDPDIDIIGYSLLRLVKRRRKNGKT